MQETFEINAEVRSDMGKGASRRLRREDKIPAIIYGGGQDPQNLTLSHNEMMLHLQNEAFYSHILSVKVGGKGQKAILRDVQRHPSRPILLHVDFQRVSDTETIRMSVPLHFLNEETSIGVKQQGGIVSHVMSEIEISCQAKNLPEYIEVDLADLEVGQAIHLSEIKLPEGVEIVELSYGEEHDQPVVNIHKPRAATEEDTTEEAAEGEAPAAAAEGDQPQEGGE